MLLWLLMRRLGMILCVTASLPAFAWGPEGHRLVARIAGAQLTPAVRARVLAILGPGDTMSSVASWADSIRNQRRETYKWHFIDIPIHARHLVMARDCPNDDCVLGVIPKLRHTLEDAGATPQQQREALMFLIHFIGDMHQPLHCSDNGDKGGNGVKVEFNGRQTDLHSIWDSGFLARMGTENTLLPALSRVSVKHAKKWNRGSVNDWAEEIHRVAQKDVYGRLPKNRPIAISAEYEAMADQVIRRELEKAGAHLAAVLNQTLR
jgi:nuclease S1